MVPASQSQATSLRLFVALRLPQDVRTELTKAQTELRRILKNAAGWTPPEQFHLTLKFLGSVDRDDLDTLIKQLGESLAPFGPLSLAVAGLGVFPERGTPRVIWAGVSDSHQQLARLQGAIEQATAKFAPQASPEPFRGHVTLGRVREARGGWRRDLEVFLKSRAGASFGMWMADRVELMRSELSSTGAIHYPLAEVLLAAK